MTLVKLKRELLADQIENNVLVEENVSQSLEGGRRTRIPTKMGLKD